MSRKSIIVSLIAVMILAGIYGFLYFYRQDVSANRDIDAAIIEYFETNPKKYFTQYYNHDSYVEAHKIFKVEKNLLNRYFVYTYTIYGTMGNDEKFTSGSYVPKVYVMKGNGSNKFQVIKSKEPMDGEDYGSSTRKMFPKEIAEILLKDHMSLNSELEKKLNYIQK